ncbi:MAG TPA: Trm112 family protein [Candidatus Limnocylindrales bacterium]|nr:Trm112 family protein [Candidatus Limnocylindrales bacterium]
MPVSKELLDVLVCPACKGELRPTPALDALDCPRCKLRFSVVDDIPVMLVDQATPLPAN